MYPLKPLLQRIHFQTHKLYQSHIQTMVHTQMWGSIKAAWMHVCQMSARCDPRKTNEKINMDNNINMHSWGNELNITLNAKLSTMALTRRSLWHQCHLLSWFFNAGLSLINSLSSWFQTCQLEGHFETEVSAITCWDSRGVHVSLRASAAYSHPYLPFSAQVHKDIRNFKCSWIPA